MKKRLAFVGEAFLSGFLIVVPLYLAVLLLLRGMKTVAGLVKPIALLIPDSIPAEKALSLLLLLAIFLLVGIGVRARWGRMARDRIEKTFFERIPGYTLLRSLTYKIV